MQPQPFAERYDDAVLHFIELGLGSLGRVNARAARAAEREELGPEAKIDRPSADLVRIEQGRHNQPIREVRVRHRVPKYVSVETAHLDGPHACQTVVSSAAFPTRS